MSDADAVEVVAQAIHDSGYGVDHDDWGACARAVMTALLATGSTEYGVRYPEEIDAPMSRDQAEQEHEDALRIVANEPDGELRDAYRGTSVVQRRSVLVTSAWENQQ